MDWRLPGFTEKIKASDEEAIVTAMREADKNPVSRPFDKNKLAHRPKAKIGSVTVPEADEAPLQLALVEKEATAHDDIQWILLKGRERDGSRSLGGTNDRGKVINGHRVMDLARLRKDLPLQFDEATNRTIELIEVPWLKGNATVAAFEIESARSVYSGLLRCQI